MKKRQSPKETIESHDSKVEHIYIKFPREGLQDVTLTSTDQSAYYDDKKLVELLNQRIIKKPGQLSRFQGYTDIHNHPLIENEIHDEALPSTDDIKSFLQGQTIKTMVIAQQDVKTGEVQGYVILRKKRVRPSEEANSMGKYELSTRELRRYYEFGYKNPKEAMKKLADKYELQYKWVAAKGYELPSERKTNVGSRFVKKSELEKTILATSLISFFGAIFFLLSNFTGNVVFVSDNVLSNWIGGALFIIGIIGAFVYFKIR